MMVQYKKDNYDEAKRRDYMKYTLANAGAVAGAGIPPNGRGALSVAGVNTTVAKLMVSPM